MDPLWIFLSVGLGMGIILSVLFGMYNKNTSVYYSKNIFGMSSTKLITDAIILLVGTSFLFLSTVSFIVKDLNYPQKSPLYFTIETLMMSLFSALTIFVMTIFRGYQITSNTFLEFSVLAMKFGILHILLQFSGFYSYIFPPL
jgi:hypothetical protein